VRDFLRDIRRAAATTDPETIRAVVERYMAVDYIQHSQGVAPGREGYLQGWLSRLKEMPQGRMPMPSNLYFIAEGDLVVWISERPDMRAMSGGGSNAVGRPKYNFNMVRIANGRLAEHRDSD
jgi:predicted SnoaL-like aldol condensation-catalyzing enzyme